MIDTQEAWLPIASFSGPFEVSNHGRVRRGDSVVASCYGSTKTLPQRVLRMRVEPDGYVRVKLSNNGRKKSFAVHRLVAEAFIPNPDILPFINHIDFNKANNRADNLEWCTAAQNNEHTRAHGRERCLRGREHPQAVSVRQIDPTTRREVRTFSTQTEAANAMGVRLGNLARAVQSGWRCGGYFWERVA